MALALSAGARRADSRLLQASSSGVGQGFFVGTRMPIPAPDTPCPPGPASPTRPTGTGPAARGVWPRSGRGWSRAPPDPCTPGTQCDPSPPARCPRRPRPRPEYHRWWPVSGLRRGHPVGADQGPVQAGVRLFPLAQPLKDLGKVRGPVGDHPQGLMQIPVGRGPAHPRVAGQGGQGGARHHPPQQEHGLNPAGGRPLPGPRVVRPAVGRQPQADGVGDGLGNIASGRIRHPRGDPLVAVSVVRTHYPGPVPARTTPTPPNPSRTTAPIPAPEPSTRKARRVRSRLRSGRSRGPGPRNPTTLAP